MFSIFIFSIIVKIIVSKIEVAYGERSVISEFPHLVLIKNTITNELCHGGLINSKTVLTAAHCLVGSGVYKVGYKSSDRYELKYVDVETIIPHPGHTPELKQLDIGLAILNEGLEESKKGIRYMNVYNGNIQVGKKLWVTGWGKTESGSIPQYFRKVFIPLKPAVGVCTYNNIIQPEFTQLCIGDGTKDSCQGDSGGPAVFINNLTESRWNGFGIVSYNDKVGTFICGAQGNYGVYTNISFFHDWIWENAEGSPPPVNNELGPLLYIGDKLDESLRTCFDIKVDDDAVCAGKGECYAIDHCECNSIWVGGDDCGGVNMTAVLILVSCIFGGICLSILFCFCIFQFLIFRMSCCQKIMKRYKKKKKEENKKKNKEKISMLKNQKLEERGRKLMDKMAEAQIKQEEEEYEREELEYEKEEAKEIEQGYVDEEQLQIQIALEASLQQK